MSVRLASQVLSDLMAKGIAFYRDHEGIDSLKDSHETQQFVEIFNKTFDALNRKYPAEGIRINSHDFDVLNETYSWINLWESNVKNNLIPEEEYLTKNTVDGLRVTIRSTIELSTYLLKECEFKYVLSSKMNQDHLEVWVYKMLSVYLILKPPKTGNCKILEKNTPKITIDDIKSIFVEDSVKKPEKILQLQNKLDNILTIGELEVEDVFENDIHNYCTPYKSQVSDCVIYYIGGKTYSCKSEAAFTNLKSKGKLIHPNENFYQLIVAIENSFSKNCKKLSIFEDTFDDVLDNSAGLLIFPCSEHKNKILMFILKYYITTRMRQYANIENKNQQKISSKKKKSAKLVIT
ncbi:hypothetical protein AGLY_001488 [Aphis glycines]|uniref:Transposable element P transposase-like GTP-binding insertion domain-containing protein n=1 Tax=Aphis glycines TaxID=307491 RepID=A0A6G0U6R8_APHGL|nr:hypothetical protein AGLY_001488 [Aphis glycines]